MINKKNSNRGGALLSVVIVMAIAGVLGALAISIAYTNFTMKVVDKKSKDNFYSAEKILEELCVGLEEVVSKEYTNAYTEVMENYSTATDIDDIETEFKNAFVVNMISRLQIEGDSSKYQVLTVGNKKGLDDYIKNTYTGYQILSTNNQLDTLEDGLALRNVCVKYKQGNFYNEITTDIKISIPAVHFSKVSSMPEISEFSYIAEGGVDIIGGAGIDLVGKGYSGANINIGSGAIFKADDPKSVLVVSKGEVYLEGNATLQTGNKTALWTEAIATKKLLTLATAGTENQINLAGRVYVNDDTTLNAYGDKLTLKGQYYGFSNEERLGANAEDNRAGASSAIIINGKQTQIDMSQLDTLVLAGTSYVSTKGSSYTIGTGEDAVTSTTSQNVLMGDSVAIKSNQLAYLVPVECAGIVSNPMTHAQYKTLTAPDEDGNPTNWEEKALGTYLTSIRGTIAAYGDVKIVPVFEQNRNDGGTVYLYLEFADAEVASQYFMDYYSANKAEVDNYIRTYLNLFKFAPAANDSARIVTRGNYLLPVITTTNGTTNYTGKYEGGTGNVSDNVQELTNYESTYTALCKKLITNESSLTNAERAGTVYSNLVDEAAINAFFTYLNANEILIKNIGTNGNTLMNIQKMQGVRGAVFNGDVKVYVVDNNDAGSNTAYQVTGGAGIVIATGDVVVADDWKGLIICGGKLTNTGDTAVFTHDPEAVGTAMQMTWTRKVGSNDPETFKVLNFFKSGSEYTTESFGNNADKTDVRNCISYENYKAE